jgi:hypothetical protein
VTHEGLEGGVCPHRLQIRSGPVCDHLPTLGTRGGWVGGQHALTSHRRLLVQGDATNANRFTVWTGGAHSGEAVPLKEFEGIDPAVRSAVDGLLNAGARPNLTQPQTKEW